MKEYTKGVLNGILASVSYGTNPLFSLPMYSRGIGVNSVLFYRYFIASLVFFLWIKYVKKVSLKITLKEGFQLFALGLLFSLSSLTLFAAFNYIASGIACTILFIYPIMVALIMFIFYKEKITKSVVFAIFLTGVGILLLSKSTGKLNFHGIELVLLSALLYSLYIVFVNRIKSISEMQPEKLTFYVMLFGLLVYIVNLDFCTDLQPLTSPFLWLCALGLSLIPTIISVETINKAIRVIGSTKTAVLGALEPITANILGILFFHEAMTPKIFIGICLIISGVMFIILHKDKHLTE